MDAPAESLNGTRTRYLALRRLRQHRMAVIGLCLLTLIAAMCVLGPVFSKYSYHEQSIDVSAQPPSAQHILGTDILGRDLFVRICYGGQVSFMVGLAATFVALLIGTVYGTIAGMSGGRVERYMMHMLDVLYPLPFTLFIILLMVYCGRNILLMFLAIGCVKWFTLARIVRTQIGVLKTQPFTDAARCLGQNAVKIWWKHLLPNTFSPIIIYTTLTIPTAMLDEAFISFLGIGIQPPMSSWGLLIWDGASNMEAFPWMLLFPALFFALTLFSLNFIGDGLRDALDPRK